MQNKTIFLMTLPALVLAGCNSRDIVSSIPAAYTGSCDVDDPACGGEGGTGGGQGGSGGSAGMGGSGGGYGGCAGEGGSGGGGAGGGGGEGGSGGMGGEGGGGGMGGEGCSLTQGYWKNHEKAWPVNEMKLGDVTYTKAELLAILRTAVVGNGLVSLSHQLIAARLNMASGASGGGIEMTIAAADAMIGALVVPPKGDGSLPTETTAALNEALTAFNEGKVGPGHCGDGGSGGKPPEVQYTTTCVPPTTTPPTYPPGTLE